MLNILNLGCGKTPLKDTRSVHYVNLDMVKCPNVFKYNILKIPYPFASETFNKVFLFHTIEHIGEGGHPAVLREIHRILKPEGQLVISYPEFLKCSSNYATNLKGERDYWKACIFGRGRDEWDRHRALMDTPFFVKVLEANGFPNSNSRPEKPDDWNTIVTATKGPFGLTYEELLQKEYA